MVLRTSISLKALKSRLEASFRCLSWSKRKRRTSFRL